VSSTVTLPRVITSDDLETHRDLLRRAGARAALSHEVAAQLLGIELLEDPTTLRVTVPRNRSRLTLPDAKVVRADLDADELVEEDGLRVTSAARTVADLARVLPPAEALVAADSALRNRLVDMTQLAPVLTTALGSGARALRLVGAHLDPASGSVMETLLRWHLLEAGLPAPRTQFRISDERRVEVARVDFCWPTQRLVVEADGFAFHSDRVAFRRDRARGNELVRLGWRLLRFTWEDVRTRPGHVTGLVRACLATSRRAARPRTGTVPSRTRTAA